MEENKNILEKKIIGSPYFISAEDNEHFKIVKAVTIASKVNSWIYIFDEEKELILGRDMLEVPTRRLIIGVEHLSKLEGLDVGLCMIEECRKLAKLCLCDYASNESIVGSCDSLKISDRYSIVYPRLFRKIIDN